MTSRDDVLKEAMSTHFSAVQHAEMLAALKGLGEVTMESAELFDGVAAYQGFDPKVTLKRFYDLSKNGAAPAGTNFLDGNGAPDPDLCYVIEVALGVEGTPKTWWIQKTTDFARDLAFFVGLYATRGTDVGKIKLRSTDQMAAVIQKKSEAYGIKAKGEKRPAKGKGRARAGSAEVGAGEENLSKEEITLARLASCVPHLVCDYYKAEVGRVLVIWPET